MTQDDLAATAIELLVVDSSLSDTERNATALRNAGIAVHVTRVDQEADLRYALRQTKHDIVLHACDLDSIDVRQALDEHEAELPLILLYSEQVPDILQRATRVLARDFVAKDDLEHLKFVVRREFHDFQLRRQLKDIEHRLSEAESRATALIQSSQDAIAYVHEGMHVHANATYLQLFGYVDMDDLEGLPLLDMVAVQDHQKLKGTLRSLAQDQNQRTKLEALCETSDGNHFEATLEFSPATIDGEPCTQIIIRDQSQRKELEQKLQQLSSQDLDTGLYNRQHFTDALHELSEAEQLEARGLLYIAIDNFQELRSGGIAASDAVLKEIAKILDEQASGNDLLARFGDHSFTLSRQGELDEIREFAEKIRSTIEHHIFETEQFVSPSCRIGIAYKPAQAPLQIQEMINQAYQACEAARQEGGNCVTLYEVAHAQKADGGQESSEIDLGALIKNALENDFFRLVFQPVVSLQGDTNEHYDVFVRLLDKNNDEIKPGQFLQHAEQSGQMREIDRWVVKRALAELSKQRQQENRKVKFFISLSNASLEDNTTLLWICDYLRDTKTKGSWIIFQVSEDKIRTHIKEAKRLFEGLKKINCQLTIDHFGEVQKSESLLKHLPIDMVKFHGSFMQNLAKDQNKQDRLNELNAMVQESGVKTIATMVEEANTLPILWNVGVNYIQGYFVQEPSETINYDFSA